MTLVPGGHDCYCGRQGCAECYCSLNSLLGDSDNLEEFFEKKISRRYRLYRKMGGLFKTSVHSDQQPAYGSGAYRYIRQDMLLLTLQMKISLKSVITWLSVLPLMMTPVTSFPAIMQILFSEYFVFLLFFTFFSDYLLTFSFSCDIIISTKEKEDGPPIS